MRTRDFGHAENARKGARIAAGQRKKEKPSKAYLKKKQEEGIAVPLMRDYLRKQENVIEPPQVRWRVLRKFRVILALSVHGGDATDRANARDRSCECVLLINNTVCCKQTTLFKWKMLPIF